MKKLLFLFILSCSIAQAEEKVTQDALEKIAFDKHVAMLKSRGGSRADGMELIYEDFKINSCEEPNPNRFICNVDLTYKLSLEGEEKLIYQRMENCSYKVFRGEYGELSLKDMGEFEFCINKPTVVELN